MQTKIWVLTNLQPGEGRKNDVVLQTSEICFFHLPFLEVGKVVELNIIYSGAQFTQELLFNYRIHKHGSYQAENLKHKFFKSAWNEYVQSWGLDRIATRIQTQTGCVQMVQTLQPLAKNLLCSPEHVRDIWNLSADPQINNITKNAFLENVIKS